jgi:hypothetical protein
VLLLLLDPDGRFHHSVGFVRVERLATVREDMQVLVGPSSSKRQGIYILSVSRSYVPNSL